MQVNHLSSSNGSFIATNLTSASVSFSIYSYCLVTRPSSFIFIAIDISILLLVFPLCVFVLYRGIHQWLQKSSTSSAAVSHSDCFTYHMAAMELVGVLGYILNLAGICKGDFTIIFAGGFFTSLIWYGQIFFHILTCVERYLAVVHPVIYLKLKNENGIRIRNISIGCAWMLSLVGMSVMMMASFFSIVDLCIAMLSLTLISFWSVSVLFVLVRPRPGEQGNDREKLHQLKRRAFCTIIAILTVLVVRFASNMAWELVFMSGRTSDCFLLALCDWLNIPSSLVLQLLFLHRTGAFIGCLTRTQSKKEKHLQRNRISYTTS